MQDNIKLNTGGESINELEGMSIEITEAKNKQGKRNFLWGNFPLRKIPFPQKEILRSSYFQHEIVYSQKL